jgi:hypothetical protein
MWVRLLLGKRFLVVLLLGVVVSAMIILLFGKWFWGHRIQREESPD